MQDILVVVDMQNDFIDGALGTKEAQAIVPKVIQKTEGFTGTVFFTRDTHEESYLQTQEGKNLPVPHCIRNTEGWQIRRELQPLQKNPAVDKGTFGSAELGALLREENEKDTVRSVTFIGLCTDICVISNALLVKAFLPEAEIIVDASCCAGVTPESHHTALAAMRACQITILNEDDEKNGAAKAVPQGRLTAYVDGSFDKKLGRYAFGCVLITPEGDVVKESGNGNNPQSLALRNVSGEMLGAMFAVKWAMKKGFQEINIHYDYTGIEQWATHGWRAKNELTQKYAAFMDKCRQNIGITFTKVAAHTGDFYNEEADRLAKDALRKADGIPEIVG